MVEAFLQVLLLEMLAATHGLAAHRFVLRRVVAPAHSRRRLALFLARLEVLRVLELGVQRPVEVLADRYQEQPSLV